MPKLRIAENTVDFACGETVLDALEGAGIHVPNSCRTGVCQSCLMQACSGDVPDEAQSGISSAKRELGYFLACVCRPTSDLEVAHLGESEAITATLTAIRRCPGDVLEVRLRTTTPLDYRGGQFVTLLREDGLARPYSLASVRGADELELHVRHYPGGAMSGWLATAPVGATIEVRGPLGECFYVADDLDRPLLLVGTGTGLAPLYGIGIDPKKWTPRLCRSLLRHPGVEALLEGDRGRVPDRRVATLTIVEHFDPLRDGRLRDRSREEDSSAPSSSGGIF